MSQPMHFEDLPPARVKKFNRISAHDHILCTHPRCDARLGYIGKAWKYAPHFLLVKGNELLVATPRKHDLLTPEIESEVEFFPDRRDGVWRRSRRVANQMKRGQRIYRRRVITWLPLTDFYDGDFEGAGPALQSVIKLLPAVVECPQCARPSVIDPENFGILHQFHLDQVSDMAEARTRLQTAQTHFDRLQQLTNQELEVNRTAEQTGDFSAATRQYMVLAGERREIEVALCTLGK